MNEQEIIEEIKEITIAIHKAIYHSPRKCFRYAPDGLMRVFVNLAIDNGWTLEEMLKTSRTGIAYYYEKCSKSLLEDAEKK